MRVVDKYPLRGIVVSLNTPFDGEGGIDFPSMGRLVEMHLQEGAAGFLAPARAGEVESLRPEEKLELIRFVRERTRGRAELIAGATSATEEESVAVARAAVAAGCEGVLTEVPAPLRGDRGRVLEFFDRFAGAGMPMLMIQDLAWGDYGLPVPLITELFERIPCFRCIKIEVVPAGPKYTAVREATGGRLHVSGGWAAGEMIEALERGVDVFMPTAMTAFYARIFTAHARGDVEDARAWFHRILPVLAFTRQHLDVAIQFYKRLMVHRGIFACPTVRGCAIGYDAYHEVYGRRLIEYLDGLGRP
jgi:4-hydroxy-tetrahydrodipicolinate synthase